MISSQDMTFELQDMTKSSVQRALTPYGKTILTYRVLASEATFRGVLFNRLFIAHSVVAS